MSAPVNDFDLIGLIYDSVLDEARWGDVLLCLQQRLGFANATLASQALTADKPVLVASSGIESDFLARIPDYSHDFIERWGGAARVRSLPQDWPAVLSWVNPKGNWDHTGYYREWARPQGIIDIMAIGVSLDRRSVGSIVLGRHQRAMAITREDVLAARQFVPHLQRAAAIGQVLRSSRRRGDSLAATLDGLTAPLFLVGATLGIVHANRAAEGELCSGALVCERAGTLRLVSPAAHAKLAEAVNKIGGKLADVGSAASTIPIQGADGEGRLLYVLPLHMQARWRDCSLEAVAAVMMTPGAGTAPGDLIAQVGDLYGLTRAEVDVFEALARGLALNQIALTRRVSLATVKTHMQHVFDKTGVRRQADLISLVSALRLPA